MWFMSTLSFSWCNLTSSAQVPSAVHLFNCGLLFPLKRWVSYHEVMSTQCLANWHHCKCIPQCLAVEDTHTRKLLIQRTNCLISKARLFCVSMKHTVPRDNNWPISRASDCNCCSVSSINLKCLLCVDLLASCDLSSNCSSIASVSLWKVKPTLVLFANTVLCL